jgi:hypothetical protein
MRQTRSEEKPFPVRLFIAMTPPLVNCQIMRRLLLALLLTVPAISSHASSAIAKFEGIYYKGRASLTTLDENSTPIPQVVSRASQQITHPVRFRGARNKPWGGIEIPAFGTRLKFSFRAGTFELKETAPDGTITRVQGKCIIRKSSIQFWAQTDDYSYSGRFYKQPGNTGKRTMLFGDMNLHPVDHTQPTIIYSYLFWQR